MEVVEIKYGRKFNIGNYESEEIVLTAVLAEGEDAQEHLVKLKELVLASHAGTVVPKEVEDALEVIEEVVEEEEEIKAPKASNSFDEEEETDDEEEDEEEEEVVEEKPKKKRTKKTTAPYQRSNSTHKTLFGEMLTELFPKWDKVKALKDKAVAASKALEGVDFLDSEGEVLSSFTKELKKLMK